MATSAGSFYATSPLAGTDFTKIRTSTEGPEFPIKTRVNLNNGKIAIYLIAGDAIGPGISGSTGGAALSGTASASAGPFMSMAGVTTSAGDYFWARTSADQALP